MTGAASNGAQGTAELPPVADEFDLDVLERETTQAPFRFKAGGHSFVLSNPDELDWHAQEDLDSEDLTKIFGALLGPEQFAQFDQIPALPAWKLERLMRAWGAYFGITVPESGASSTSSATTARPSRPISVSTTAPG